MRNPLISGITSCSISIVLWTIMLLATWLEGDTYIAVAFYMLWLLVGVPVSLGFTIRSFYLIHRKPKSEVTALPLELKRKSKVMVWLSVALILVPAVVMLFTV
jgi:hypothetical protein